jgi:hypothetical protein
MRVTKLLALPGYITLRNAINEMFWRLPTIFQTVLRLPPSRSPVISEIMIVALAACYVVEVAVAIVFTSLGRICEGIWNSVGTK